MFCNDGGFTMAAALVINTGLQPGVSIDELALAVSTAFPSCAQVSRSIRAFTGLKAGVHKSDNSNPVASAASAQNDQKRNRKVSLPLTYRSVF